MEFMVMDGKLLTVNGKVEAYQFRVESNENKQ